MLSYIEFFYNMNYHDKLVSILDENMWHPLMSFEEAIFLPDVSWNLNKRLWWDMSDKIGRSNSELVRNRLL